jgi:3-isopropylmalate/(R)-2-methylmalate dehydratase large subunit
MLANAPTARTLFAKIWQRHSIIAGDDDETLLYIDRCLIHEGSRPGFVTLEKLGKGVRRPSQVIACADHYMPTTRRAEGIDGIEDESLRMMVNTLEANAKRYGCTLIGMTDPRQGILHVVAPEQGITQPGMVIAGGDSHTSTHGAFGAFAFGVGASEVMHVLASQTLWRELPKTMRITIDGRLSEAVVSKDMMLAIIGLIGTGGALGHVIEFAGSAARALSMEARMTLCNMAIEAGARAGMVAPDETTFEYLADRPAAPSGPDWERALAYWRSLPTDEAAEFDREVAMDGAAVVPMATWGTSPEQCAPITDRIPDPSSEPDAARRGAQLKALEYMDLRPNTPLSEIKIDKVFIGSCTNARIEDLRLASAVVDGRKIVVPGLVVPGSTSVKRQAEAEGLDRIFKAAGFQWRDSACSLCTSVADTDQARPGDRYASTANRNFPGRQGVGVRTHLMSPTSAAATAVLGHIASASQL